MSDTEKDARKYLIPGLERGLIILMELSRSHREMSFAEIVKCVDIPKATAYRAIQTLEYMGFIRRHPSTGLYSLGVNVLRLGFEYVASLDVVQVGQPVIESLRDKTGCSSHIAIRDGRDVIYVARVSAANATVRRVSVGHAAAGASHLAGANAADRPESPGVRGALPGANAAGR